METSAGLLNIAAVATELNIPPIAVRRLIARRRLAGTELIADGDWRVTAADLTAYIKSGAVDLKMPELDNYGGWFEPTPRRDLLTLFERRILAAIEDQRLTDAQVAQRATEISKFDSSNRINVELKASPAIMAVVDGPLPTTSVDAVTSKADAAILARFTKFGYLWAVKRLRTIAGDVISGMPSPGLEPHVLRLFKRPEDYDSILAATKERFATAIVVLSNEVRQVPVPDKEPQPVNVQYTLQAGKFAKPAWLNGAVEIAF